MSDSVNLWTVAHQASLSLGFSRQEFWTGLPCHPSEDLSNPGVEPESLTSSAWQAGSLLLVERCGQIHFVLSTFSLFGAEFW